MSAVSVLRMFGALRLETGEEVLTKFPTKKSALILARLAIARNNSIGRDELAEQLWPDDFLDQTRLRLRQELRRLRMVVGDFGKHMRSDRQMVEIEPGCLVSDVQLFDEALSSAATANDSITKAEILTRAVSYLDGPFLAGYQEPWVLALRRDYEEKARRTWLALAETHQALGSIEQAVTATMHAVQHAPLDLEANSSLIRRLVEVGQVAQAKQAFLEFDGMMFRELGRHAPESVRAPIRERSTEPDSDANPSDPIVRSVVPRPLPLYGREELIESIQSAVARPGACVVLVGVIGVGKSHLLKESAWQFSRSAELPVRFGGDPTPTKDGLFVIEEGLSGQLLVEAIKKAAASGWRVLAESRVRLDSDRINGILVNPLSVPMDIDSPEAIHGNPSVQVLISKLAERGNVSLSEKDLRHLAELARRLDGLPAALKVFAMRLMIQTPEQVVQTFDEALAEYSQLSTADGETVASTISNLVADLPEHVRQAFLELVVLGGASADLASELAFPQNPAEVWRTLEKNCLIVIDDDGSRLRYHVPRPIAFCAESMFVVEVRSRIAARAWRVASHWAFETSRLMAGPRQDYAFDAVQAELPNLEHGLEWAIGSDPEVAGILVVGIWRTVCARGNPLASGELLLRGTRVGAPLLEPKLAGEAWVGTAMVLAICGRLVVSEEAFLNAIKMYESTGDRDMIAWANLNYATDVLVLTDIPRAIELSKLASEMTSQANDRAIAMNCYVMGLVEMGETAEAIRVAEEVFSERLQSNDPTTISRAYGDLAELYSRVGRPEAARPLLQEGVRRLREIGVQDMLLGAMINLAKVSLDTPDIEELLDEANAIAIRIGSNAKMLDVARVKLSMAVGRGDIPLTLKAIDEVMRFTQLSLSIQERNRSLRELAKALHHLGKTEHANAALAATGDKTEGPTNAGWQSLLSSDSHATVCVLALAMSREAIQ